MRFYKFGHLVYDSMLDPFDEERKTIQFLCESGMWKGIKLFWHFYWCRKDKCR